MEILGVTGSLLGGNQQTAVSFPDTVVGLANTAKVALGNSGNVPMQSVAVVSSGGSPDFTILDSQCGATLAGGTSCDVTVSFAPKSVGVQTSQLSVSSSNAGSQAVGLTGTGIKGSASASASALTFAAQQVGTTSATQVVTLTNIGTNVLSVSGVSVVDGAADFAQSNNCAAVPVHGSCAIDVSFTPSVPGGRLGTLALVHDGDGVTSISLSGDGRAPAASLGALSFGTTHVGDASEATATLTNLGVGSISLTAPNAAAVVGTDFSFVSTDCTSSLAAGATCNTVVRFAPTVTAPRNGTLSIATSAGLQTSGLLATGVQGAASVSSSSLSFSPLQVGTTSAVQSITVTNTGTSALAISGLSVIAGATDFAQSNDCAVVAIGSTCTVNVSFTPSADGPLSGTLAMTHDGSGVTIVSLNGAGRAQSAALTTPTFAATAVGSSSTATATLTNNGIGALSVTVPTSGSVSGADFGLVSTSCGASVAVGGNCAVIVKFSPTSVAARSGMLTIGTGAGTQSVSLGSTGIQGFASVSPGSLTFAAQQNGTTSAVQAVTVTNTGTNTLTFTGVGVSTGGTDFAQSNNCGSVAVNGTCTVNITFTPAAAGARPGTLSFTHNGGGIANVSLSGTGQAASASITSTSWGSFQVGSTYSDGAQRITNTGIGPISLTGTPSVNAPFAYLGNDCPSPIAAGGTCLVYVSFAPTAAQTYTQTLTVPTTAGTLTSTSSGTGTAPSLVLSGWDRGGSAAMGVVGYASDSGRWPTYTNTGTGPVIITAHTSTGPFWAWQGQGAPYCSIGYVVPAGGSCTFFNGVGNAAVGDYSGSSTVSYTGQGSSTTFTTGVPNYTASVRTTTANVASVAFGTVPQNQWNGPAYVRITNNASNNVLRNLAVSLSGANAGNFTIGSFNCSGGGLSGGAYCDIPVYFNPTWSANGFSATLVIAGGYPRMEPGESTVSTNALNISIPLSGNGAYSQAVLRTDLTAGWQSFGASWYGQPAWALSWTYQNTGNAPMTLVSPALSAPLAVSSNTCTNVPSNGTCSIYVINNWNADAYNASQSFTPSGATIAPAAATAAYTVKSAIPRWSTTALAFGNVTVNTSRTMNVTLYNDGNEAIDWNAGGQVAGQPAGFVFNMTNCSNVAPNGGSCVVPVTFTPTAAGAYGVGSSIYETAASRSTSNYYMSVSGNGISSVIAAFSPGSGSALYFALSENQSGNVETIGRVTVQNVGDAAMSLSASLSYLDGAYLSGCPATLAAHTQCTLLLRWAGGTGSGQEGRHTGTLSISTNGGNASFPVTADYAWNMGG